MKRNPVFLVLSIMAVAFAGGQMAHCQTLEVVQTNEKTIIRSKILNEERSILVRLPEKYHQGSERYPVVYMLDGRAPTLNLMISAVEHLAWSDMMPEMIVVGITNTDRARDMTPTAMADQPGTGGADKFLEYIEKEVIPAVESKYRVQPYRILSGHSLSGLFATHCFLTKPELFNAYFAASPFLAWDNSTTVDRATRLLTPRKELNRTLFFALGDEPGLAGAFNGFKQLLDRLQIRGLDYEIHNLQDENHWSVVAAVIQRGLRKVWKDSRMPQSMFADGISLEELEDYYKSLESKYRYAIPVPEALFNQAGAILLNGNSIQEAVRVFEKAIIVYPNSPAAHARLADALEKNGQLAKAKQHLETALKLAEPENNPRFTGILKQHLERVTKKVSQAK